MIDKALADWALWSHRHRADYRMYCRGCPCCGREVDRRYVSPFASLIRFLCYVPCPPRHADRLICLSCNTVFEALYDGPRLIGFRDATG